MLSSNPFVCVSVPDGKGGRTLKMVPAATVKTKPKRKAPDAIKAGGNASAKTLKGFIEERERIEEQIADLREVIRDINARAKSLGFDVATITAIIARRRKDPDLVAEAQAIFETYLEQLGLVED